MNSRVMACRAAGIAGAFAAMLLAHSAAAGDTMIVYGKRMQRPEASVIAQPEVDTAATLVALNDDLRASIRDEIRASLRDSFSALRVEIAKDQGAANDVEVALLGARVGV